MVMSAGAERTYPVRQRAGVKGSASPHSDTSSPTVRSYYVSSVLGGETMTCYKCLSRVAGLKVWNV